MCKVVANIAMRNRYSEPHPQSLARNVDQDLSNIHKRAVDTRMAITYLPGCIFLIKSALLLLFLTAITQECVHKHFIPGFFRNQDVIQISPTPDYSSNKQNVMRCSVMWRMLAMACIILYLDNIFYNESVFDGNGLLWTILFAFFLNQVGDMWLSCAEYGLIIRSNHMCTGAQCG